MNAVRDFIHNSDLIIPEKRVFGNSTAKQIHWGQDGNTYIMSWKKQDRIFHRPNQVHVAELSKRMNSAEASLGYLFECVYVSGTVKEWRITKVQPNTVGCEKRTTRSKYTKVRGFFLNDPIIDWLEMYGDKKGIAKDGADEYMEYLGIQKRVFVGNILQKLQLNHGKSLFFLNSIGDYIRQRSSCVPELTGKVPVNIWMHTLHSNVDHAEQKNAGKKLKIQRSVQKPVLELIWFYEDAYGTIDVDIPLWSVIIAKNKIIWILLNEYKREWSRRIQQSKEWYDVLENQGEQWNPRTHPLLLPNMNNKKDQPWHTYKKTNAILLNEPSQIWNVKYTNPVLGVDLACIPARTGRKRKRFGQLEVLDKCISSDRPFHAGHREQIHSIIKAQHPSSAIINYTMPLQKLNDRKLCFIDFEFLPGILDQGYIYLIGLIFEGTYYSWMIDQHEVSSIGERRILDEFVEWTLEHAVDHYVHWGDAEPVQLRKAMERCDVYVAELPWFDMLKQFKKSRVSIQGCLTYRLKDITARLSEHGLIDIKYSQDDCSSAADSMVLALKYYGLYCSSVHYEYCIKTIILKYNETDCSVMHRIGKSFDVW